MTFKVRLTRVAEADLDRLFDFQRGRELSREGIDLSVPNRALAALRSGIGTLKTSPFTCRKAGQSPFLRDLIIPFDPSGSVALFGSRTGRTSPFLPCATGAETSTSDAVPCARGARGVRPAIPSTKP